MGILPLFLVALATGQFSDNYDIINVFGLKALSEAECLGRRVIKPGIKVDVILAIDTSACNYYRIGQVKDTVDDFLDTMTNTATGGQELGQNVRISLVTFNTNVEVLYSFSDYDRSSDNSRLLREAGNLAFSSLSTNYDNVFSELHSQFQGTFRSDARRVLVLYTNGKQPAHPNYGQIRGNLGDLGVEVFGMSFSPQCYGEATDSQNLDKVCPNPEFFKEVATGGKFVETSHGYLMAMRSSMYTEPDAIAPSPIADLECHTAFAATCEEGGPGPKGQPGLSGRRGPPGPDGATGRNGPDGPNGDKGAMGFPGQQGDRGEPGLHGGPGDDGLAGPPGQNGNRGPPGRKGRPGPSNQGKSGRTGPPGPPGIDGSKGSPGNPGLPGNNGNPGRKGDPGFDGNGGDMGMPGGRGPSGSDARCSPGPQGPPGHTGVPGENGDNGMNGDPGKPGSDGRPGNSGSPGGPGQPGKRGKVGDAGNPGFDGCSGKDGYDGPRGPTGDLGPPGDDGHPGEKGRPGDPGELGELGLEGARGDSGPPGHNGDNGPKGSCGHEGCDGPRGPQGSSGKDGSNGTDGQPGPKGDLGCPGGNGAQGEPGKPGLIDEAELELLVAQAIRELILECHQSDPFRDPSTGEPDIGVPSRTDDIEEEL